MDKKPCAKEWEDFESALEEYMAAWSVQILKLATEPLDSMKDIEPEVLDAEGIRRAMDALYRKDAAEKAFIEASHVYSDCFKRHHGL